MPTSAWVDGYLATTLGLEFVLIDTGNPDMLSVVSDVDVGRPGVGLFGRPGRAVLVLERADAQGTRMQLATIDVTDPSAPSILSTFDLPGDDVRSADVHDTATGLIGVARSTDRLEFWAHDPTADGAATLDNLVTLTQSDVGELAGPWATSYAYQAFRFFDPATTKEPGAIPVIPEGGVDPHLVDGRLLVRDARAVRFFDILPDGKLATPASIDFHLTCAWNVATHRYRDGVGFVGIGRGVLVSESVGGMCDGIGDRYPTMLRRLDVKSPGPPQMTADLLDVGVAFDTAALLPGRLLMTGRSPTSGSPSAALVAWSDDDTKLVGVTSLEDPACAWNLTTPNSAILYVPEKDLAVVTVCSGSYNTSVALLGVGDDALVNHGSMDLGLIDGDFVRSVHFVNERLILVTALEVISLDVTNPAAPIIVSRVSSSFE